LDGSIKTAIIDETLPIFQIVDVICARIGITNTDEYSLLPDKVEEAETTKKQKGKMGKVINQIADDGKKQCN
jgi:talin